MSSIDESLLEISKNDVEDIKVCITETLTKAVKDEIAADDQHRLAMRAQRASDDDDDQRVPQINVNRLMAQAGGDDEDFYEAELHVVLFPVTHLEDQIKEHLNKMSAQDVLSFYKNLIKNESRLRNIVSNVIRRT